jgi:hypothetical protein
MIIFGVLSIAAGLLTLLLPETLHKKLPDTLEDARFYQDEKTGVLDEPVREERY